MLKTVTAGVSIKRFPDVKFVDPNLAFVDDDVKISAGTIIEPFVILKGKTRIGKNCLILAGTTIDNTIIGDNCEIGRYNIKDSELQNNIKVGKFSEIVRSTIGDESTAVHHCYLGDTTIGKGVNIGSNTIIANFDGVNKKKTVIEDGAFIGVKTCLIAPVRIGKEAIIAAGSVITQNVPAHALAITRPDLIIKKGFWKKEGKIWRRMKRENFWQKIWKIWKRIK